MGKANVASGAPTVTILFISLSAAQYNHESDWAEAGTEAIVRHRPICVQDSIVGHGRRRKQAHDEHHDWIGIRRGLCNRCGKTFTFLPPFSPPYGHYSFIARSQALQRYFLGVCCWEDAAPTVKDPDRVADPSTLRRWFRHLDSSRPPFSALRRTMLAINAWLGRTELLVHNSLPLRRHTVYPFLARFWPLRIQRKPAPLTILAWEEGWLPPTVDSGGENSTMAENLERIKQRIPLLEYLQRHKLEALSCQRPPGVGRSVSLAPGDPSFLLRQRR